jgi:branched-chain amino acid transport system substrate-binding protein
MKSILTRLMTAAAVIGMLATVPHVKAADPIKIVALYNLSAGGLASIDGPSLNGAKLMAKQINDAGGLLGGRMIELTAIDTKNDLKEAATGAKRAVSMEGVVAGIGHSDTTFALASAPLFQARAFLS